MEPRATEYGTMEACIENGPSLYDPGGGHLSGFKMKSPSMRRPVGVKGIRFGICWSRCFFLPSRHCRHPSIRTLRVSALVRSVQVGCSRFSRCCHLIIDLGSISKMKAGPGD